MEGAESCIPHLTCRLPASAQLSTHSSALADQVAHPFVFCARVEIGRREEGSERAAFLVVAKGSQQRPAQHLAPRCQQVGKQIRTAPELSKKATAGSSPNAVGERLWREGNALRLQPLFLHARMNERPYRRFMPQEAQVRFFQLFDKGVPSMFGRIRGDIYRTWCSGEKRCASRGFLLPGISSPAQKH